MGRISVSTIELIDDYNSAARKVGAGAAKLANEARKQWCDIRASVPSIVERWPGMGFSAGVHDEICKDRPDRPSPTSDRNNDDRTFKEGGTGKCDGQRYVVELVGSATQEGQDYDFDITLAGYGPITSIEPQYEEDKFDPPSFKPVLLVGFQGEIKRQTSGLKLSDFSTVSYNATVTVEEDACTPPDDQPDPDPSPPDSPPPPYWPGPYPPPGGGPYFNPPELPDFPPIELPSPPDFPDVPKPQINLNFNVDNRTFEGPQFNIDIGGPNININWDDRAPPPDLFPDPGVRKPVPLPQPGPIVRPPSGGPGLPGLPWGDIISEIVGEVIPDTGDWVDYVNLISNIINNLQDLQPGEDGTKVEGINIPYYDCDAEQFKSLLWKVKQGDASSEDLDLLSKHAQYVAYWCQDPSMSVAVPEWWTVRAGANREQLITTFRYQDRSTYSSLIIPHPNSDPAQGESPIAPYTAGDFMGREELTDNSKIVVNAATEDEAKRVLDEMASWVQSSYRYSEPKRTICLRQGQGVQEIRRVPRKVEYFSQGRATNGKPDYAWRVNPDTIQ